MRKVEKEKKESNKSAFLRRFLFMLLASFITVFGVYAQERTISGKITSKDGLGLPGATVLVKGTTRGFVTDGNGSYSITATSTDILVISFVGYLSQEIPVSGQSTIDITLDEDVKKINEVVVTAMGIKKDTRTIGYASQEVGTEDLSKAKDANAINSLIGKVAGLTIGQSSEMLSAPQILIRGSSDMLFVVDGSPINSDSWNISNDDVESYTVLKGPNAAALYGFRGQNGAILITTKKGAKDGVSVELNSSNMYLSKSYIAIPERQSEYGYGDGYAYAFGNDKFNADASANKRPNVWGPKFEGQLIPQFDSPVDATTGVREATPWLSKGANNFQNFMESGFLTSNNIALSAGGKKYDIRVSISDNYQKGIDPNTGLNITNLNLYSGYQLTKKLRVDGNINYNYQNSQNIPDVNYGPNSYTYMIQEYGSAGYDIRDLKNYWYPGYEGVQERYAEYGRCNNPYFMAHEWLRGHKRSDAYGYARLNYEITPALSFIVRTQFTGYNVLRSEKLPISTIIYGAANALKYGQYREDRRTFYENKTDAMFVYNKNITPSIYVSALLGAEYTNLDYNSSWATTGYLNVPNVYSFGNSLNAMSAYSFLSGMSTQSAYYSFDISFSKYLTLSNTGRVDKTTTLPNGKNSFFYPSVSLSSVVNDYVKLPEFISYLKVRGSFADVKGALTKSQVGPAYFESGVSTATAVGYGTGYMTSYGGPSYINQTIYGSAATYNNTSSVSLSNTVANTNLKPYSVTSYEAGLDVKFFKNRLGLDVTYFTSINGPQIYKWDVAPSTGFDNKIVNGVTTQKNGWEISMTANPVQTTSGLSWEISANWATFKETLKELYGGAKEVLINDHYYKVGDRMDEYFGYTFYRTPDGLSNSDIKGGQIIHDAGGLPLFPSIGTNYKKSLGFLNNDFTWGITNNISYKFVTLSFSIDGRVGGVVQDQVYSDMMQSGNAMDLVQGDYGAARTAEWESLKANGTITPSYIGSGVALAGSVKPSFDDHGNITNFDQLTLVQNASKVLVKSYVTSVQGFQVQEPYMISRTYAKLRDVSLTFRIPSKILAKSFIKKGTISLTARNLLYITKEKRKNIDLDQYATGFDISKVGQKSAAYSDSNNPSFNTNAAFQTPSVRQYGFSLNLVF